MRIIESANYTIYNLLMIFSFAYGYEKTDTCFDSTKQADGLDSGITPFTSAIINGKGTFYFE